MKLTAYKDWSPTGMDSKGLNTHPGGSMEDFADWLVVSLKGYEQDSVSKSNWEVMTDHLDSIDPEDMEHSIHSFNHWAYAFDLLLVAPDSAALNYVTECAEALENYLVLDEEHHSNTESEMANEAWVNYGANEVEGAVFLGLIDVAEDFFEDSEVDDYEDLELLAKKVGFVLPEFPSEEMPPGMPWEPDGSSVYFDAPVCAEWWVENTEVVSKFVEFLDTFAKSDFKTLDEFHTYISNHNNTPALPGME